MCSRIDGGSGGAERGGFGAIMFTEVQAAAAHAGLKHERNALRTAIL
jgi:hypothetical protein